MKTFFFKIKTLFSHEGGKVFISNYFQAFGLIALILGVGDILFPNTLNYGLNGLLTIGATSLIWSLYKSWPKFEISRVLLAPDAKITVKVGDLFNDNGNLIIGMSDVFDTEMGKVISPTSIQGQFLSKIYNSDQANLDKDLALALKGANGEIDKKKKTGKNLRYPIGTVAVLSNASKKYFCSAYSVMGNDLKAKSDVSKLTTSLDKLWNAIRDKGECKKIAMAVLGSDLARIGAASHSNLIKLIISSYILASRESLICKELVIYVKDSNLGKFNMLELDQFLQNF